MKCKWSKRSLAFFCLLMKLRIRNPWEQELVDYTIYVVWRMYLNMIFRARDLWKINILFCNKQGKLVSPLTTLSPLSYFLPSVFYKLYIFYINFLFAPPIPPDLYHHTITISIVSLIINLIKWDPTYYEFLFYP